MSRLHALIPLVSPEPYHDLLFAALAFVLGSVIGSFLNVCIYRMPLGMSVNQPRRSFCPQCKKSIAWYRNLPLLSWLLLGGRCAMCATKIPFRYWFVELLTALGFLWIWGEFQWQLAVAYWVFVSLLIVATFIDFDHFIIPDEITIGGTVAGVALSLVFPQLMGAESALASGASSLIGAATGFGLLWSVVELGKKAFGKKRLTFDAPAEFAWTRYGDDAELKLGTETIQWSEIFSRESDQLLARCTTVEIDGKPMPAENLTFFYNRLVASGKETALDQIVTIRATTSEVVIPREAMGFGDVKFIAAIGAFLGWKAVLFTILSASVLGAGFGVLAILFGRREWSAKIPFGPYLSLGALLWIVCGPQLLAWYLELVATPL